jgi:hypothetical protein
LGALERLRQRYEPRVAFLGIYVKEAHPEDGWVLAANRREGIAVRDPSTREQRLAAAATCAVRASIDMRFLVDEVDNEVARRYGGWPDRLYLVDREGRIAFQGDEGPAGFEPDLLEAAIERVLA